MACDHICAAKKIPNEADSGLKCDNEVPGSSVSFNVSELLRIHQ